jgi:hypothetical protein
MWAISVLLRLTVEETLAPIRRFTTLRAHLDDVPQETALKVAVAFEVPRRERQPHPHQARRATVASCSADEVIEVAADAQVSNWHI